MKDKILIGIIVVLIGVIAFEGVYLFNHWTKDDDNEVNSSNENEGAVVMKQKIMLDL